MDATIREVSEQDLLSCAKVYAEVFTEAPYRESWTPSQASIYLERFWRFDPTHCYAARVEGQLIGALFGYCYPWQDRVNYYMQELFVRSEHRRRGIGRALVKRLLKDLSPQG